VANPVVKDIIGDRFVLVRMGAIKGITRERTRIAAEATVGTVRDDADRIGR